MISFGLSPFGGPDVTPDDLAEAASRLEGDGFFPRFPQEVDTEPHAQELGAIGTIASQHAATLDRACAQAFVDMATEMLDELEHAHQLPNDNARSLEQRWDRLTAKESFRAVDRASYVRAIQGIVAAYTDAKSVLDSVEFSYIAGLQGLEPWAALQYVVSMGADYDDPVKRRALEVLLRALPTQQLGQMGAQGVPRVLVRDATDYAVWNGAQKIGQSAILKVVTDATTARNAPSRLRSYGPHSRLDAIDLNGLSDTMSSGPCSSWSALLKPAPGHIERFFSRSVAAAGDSIIDASADWRSRCIHIVVAVDATDIRPTGAAELSANLLTITERFDAMGYWTAGGVAQQVATATSGIAVYADAGNGNLRVRNTAGATRYVIGMIFGSGVLS